MACPDLSIKQGKPKGYVPCKRCKEKGLVLITRGQWKGCWTGCSDCSGCGGITYVSKEEFKKLISRA